MAVKYSFDDHLIDKQAAAEEAMLKQFEEGNYTIQNPLVVYNAYLVNPLSAVVCFNTEEEVAVTVTVLRATWDTRSRRQRNTYFPSWDFIPTTPTRWRSALTAESPM